MKKFFQSKFGKRVLISLGLLALAVGLGFLLSGFTGAESAMWQRCVFCLASFGTGLSALFFLLLGWPGLFAGYAIVLIQFLPELLPEPWDRYYALAYLALLLLIPVIQKQWKKAHPEKRKKSGGMKKAKKAAQPEELTAPADEVEPETEGEPDFVVNGASLLAHFQISDRNYQLIRTPGELRAYRVGGELRGIDATLLQDPQKPLRPLGKKDLTFPLDETLRITMKTRYDSRLDREVLVVRLRSGRHTHRMTCFAQNSQIRAFFARCTSNCVEKKKKAPEKPKMPEKPADRSRVAALRKANVALAVFAGLVDLPWLFLNVPYRLFAILALLPPLIALALCCIFPNDTTLTESKRSEGSRASFTGVMIISSLVPTLRTLLDFNFPQWGRLLWISAVVYVVLLALVLLLSTEWRARKSVLISVGFALLYYSIGFTAQVNYVFDRAEPTSREAVVEEMRISTSSKSPDTYNLTVVLPDGQTQELSVAQEFYEQTEIGDTVTVETYSGALGIAYADAH